MAKSKRSGQAAMEFLMTYGWAILVVLIVIGALAYFGVLNPQSFLPKRCNLGPGLTCVDSKLAAAGSLDIIISNGLGNAIKITGIELNDSPATALGACFSAQEVTLTPGQTSSKITFPCGLPTTLTVGQRIKAVTSVSYTDQATGFTHTQKGDIIIDVE